LESWFFKKISDYWDNQSKNSIFEYSQTIGKYPPNKQEKILSEIREAIFEHVAALDDEQLNYAAFVIADDIYKSANEISLFNSYISDYLEASAGTFFELLNYRGYCLHYLANTVFAGSAADGFIRPLHIFSHFFMPSGITYVCPHEIALDLMKRDGLSESDYDGNIAIYLPEAEDVGNMVIDKCHENNDNYFNLQIDGEGDKFQKSFERVKDKGIITVFRSEPPVSGTTCTVKFPDESFKVLGLFQNN
jgi:hypothetical protein